MNRREVIRMIRKLSKRRHDALMRLAGLTDYKSLNQKEISQHRLFISELSKEIDELLGRL